MRNKSSHFGRAKIIPYNFGLCQAFCDLFLLSGRLIFSMMKMAFCDFLRYNLHMKTKYTKTQLSRFHRFCDRHGLQFSNKAEYLGALEQFLSE